MEVLAGSTDVTSYFNLRLAADGTAATGLTITDLDLQYTRSGATPAAKVDATALAATNSAHGDNQAIEIDGTDQPGLYRVDWPDAAFAAGVREVILTVKHTTTFIEHLRVNLTPVPSNLSQIGSDAQSATDLKDFADAGYDPSTNKVQGVVLTDTVTTLTNLPAITANWLTAAGTAADFSTELRTAINGGDYALSTDANGRIRIVDGTAAGELDTSSGLVTLTTTSRDAIADQVWDELLSGHAVSGSTGEALSAAGGAGDPWITNLPGSYTSGQAGFIVGTNLNSTISSRSSHSAADVWASATRTLTALDEDSTTIDMDATITGALSTPISNIAAILADTGTDGVVVNDHTATGLTELRNYLHGADVALQIDASGYAKVSDGTGTGQIDLTSGGVLVSTLATQAKLDVNAEVVDCLNTDTYAEPGQGTPAATASLVTKLGWLHMAWRNKKTQTSSEQKLFGDDTTTVVAKSATSDDGTTLTIGEFATGP